MQHRDKCASREFGCAYSYKSVHSFVHSPQAVSINTELTFTLWHCCQGLLLCLLTRQSAHDAPAEPVEVGIALLSSHNLGVLTMAIAFGQNNNPTPASTAANSSGGNFERAARFVNLYVPTDETHDNGDQKFKKLGALALKMSNETHCELMELLDADTDGKILKQLLLSLTATYVNPSDQAKQKGKIKLG